MNQPPAIKENVNLQVEEYIKDWNLDEASHEFALQMGTFLLEFIDSLHTSGVSRKTLRKHKGNCWLIGSFECDYGHHDPFSPAIFLDGSDFFYEFKHKVSNSKYAIASYKSTWRKIGNTHERSLFKVREKISACKPGHWRHNARLVSRD